MATFLGTPSVTSHDIGAWKFTPQCEQLLDDVVICTVGEFWYSNLVIRVPVAVQVASGHIFCLEQNMLLPPTNGDGMVFGCFVGQRHASYERVPSPSNGIQLYLAMAKIVPEALPESARETLATATYASVVEMYKQGRLKMGPLATTCTLI